MRGGRSVGRNLTSARRRGRREAGTTFSCMLVMGAMFRDAELAMKHTTHQHSKCLATSHINSQPYQPSHQQAQTSSRSATHP
jgi:hypothetical protein